MTKLILIYLALQTIYVILNTLTTIWKINGGKWLAAVSSGVCYALYVYVLIYTTAPFDNWIKALLTFGTNFIGVLVSRIITEKLRKNKLWEIVATVDKPKAEWLVGVLNNEEPPFTFNYSEVSNNKIVFRFYSENKSQSVIIKKYLDLVEAKYIVHEEQVKL